jgi:hypothetical protein
VAVQGHVGRVHDVHQLQYLPVDLADDLVRADGDQGYAGDLGVLGGRNAERLEVVAEAGSADYLPDWLVAMAGKRGLAATVD